jgi:hypothetical protein
MAFVKKFRRRILICFPIKFVLQEIKPPDYPKRMDYCRWFEKNMNDEIKGVHLIFCF